MSEEEQVEMSSESDPEDLDLDLINDIHVHEQDIDELAKLIATTKHRAHPTPLPQPQGQAADLFLRNFFIKHKMNETLAQFQQEWYELAQQGGAA
jgi:hypothetical protein